MKQLFTMVVAAICLHTTLFAQTATWYFGDNIGIRFTGTFPPDTIPHSSMSTNEGSGIVTDDAGNILFYSDGASIWNHSGSLAGSLTTPGDASSSTQTALVLPVPGTSCDTFFVFTTPAVEDWSIEYPSTPAGDYRGIGGTYDGSNRGLRVSRIAVGPGPTYTPSIIENNLPINSILNLPVAEKLTQTSDGNGGYWIATHSFANDSFYTYHVLSSYRTVSDLQGIVPVVSKTGYLYGYADIVNGYRTNGNSGQMKFNQTATRIGVANGYSRDVRWHNFNVVTGAITGDNIVPLSKPVMNMYDDSSTVYGLEFSPDGTCMYFAESYSKGYTSASQYVYQYSFIANTVTPVSPVAYSTSIGTNNNRHYPFGALQLGPDGRIYVARPNRPQLDVITAPNNSGVACGYLTAGVNLGSKLCGLGLPTVASEIHCSCVPPEGYVDIYDTTFCIGDTMYLNYGGGHYYHIIVDGILRTTIYQDSLNTNDTTTNSLPPGTHHIDFVVSMDHTFMCTDTISYNVISSCCSSSSVSLSDTSVCLMDSVCITLTSSLDSFIVYIDSIGGDHSFSDTLPGIRCGTLATSEWATPGYHQFIAVFFDKRHFCTDTQRATIYIKPDCQCGISQDTCPAMNAAFSYSYNSGSIVLHDESANNPTYVEWYVEGKQYNTGAGDSLVHKFSHSGTYQICLTVHHLIFGSDLCCSDDTCITINVGVDTCELLKLRADYTYIYNSSSPYSIQLDPTKGNVVTADVSIWNFGDGQSEYQNGSGTTYHKYDTAGFYTVCLTQIWYLNDKYCCIDTQCYVVYVAPIQGMMRVYPNPFKETMNANFHVIQDGYVTVEILDIMGKVVATPVAHEFFEDGYYTRMFNAGKLLPGVYTYRYLADDRVLKGKIVKE